MSAPKETVENRSHKPSSVSCGALFAAALAVATITVPVCAAAWQSTTQTQSGQGAPAGGANGNTDGGSGGNTPSLGGALGGLLNAMGGALGGAQHVTPVDFRTLQGLLPEALPGFKRTNAGGANKAGMGIKSASA